MEENLANTLGETNELESKPKPKREKKAVSEEGIENIQSELLIELYKKVQKLESEKVNSEEVEKVVKNTPSLPNENRVKPEPPRKIVYQILGYVADDAKKDGAYHPGKAYGIGKHKLLSYLLNTNLKWDSRELDKWKTGFEIDEIDMNPSYTEEYKNQLIQDVKKARAWLEYKLGVSLDAKNRTLWEDRLLEISDTGKVYDTSKNDDHLILYYNIIGGGYPDVAISYEQCKKEGKKLYLAVYEEEAKRRMGKEKVKYKAFAKLEDIDNNWSLEDCLYLLYALPLKKNHGFTLNTPKDMILDELNSFIAGEGLDDKKKRPIEFLDTVAYFSSDPQYIKTKALFKAALYYGFIITTKEKNFINKQTGFVYGSSEQQALEKLIDIRNLEELGYIKGKINEKWNK